MSSDGNSFTERHGLVRPDPEITVRDDAPAELRGILPGFAYKAGLDWHDLRSLVTSVLYRVPDPNNWSPPNVANEVHSLLSDCEWNEVYDIIERIHQSLAKRDADPFHSPPGVTARRFADEINTYFRKRGIGWQLIDGLVQVRGAEGFEIVVRAASHEAARAGLQTASEQIHEALLDLSRRPRPDAAGAVHHAFAALECAARRVSKEEKLTLGEILKKHPSLVPPPLNVALEKCWGFASDKARHLREGGETSYEEAELLVGVAASAATYLAKKILQKS